ncbi:hypothetical protein GALMADRAFT_258766 [Galerina marginata CBS 339.88]|uniref:4-dimethylallyltryptophan N-methyltransferase n=1 Tax=Galerina marginata (strain CBS 339.88) TaxID=685588 RepID=A0A067SGM5_GALM3|nr:hypothetical protein GALMADRAFT_258766 [Galerina marginata CBS 339.88]
MSQIEVLDIRGSKEATGSTPHLRAEILQGLSKSPGHRTIPGETLFDETGLKMYDEGMKTWRKWYYPFEAEKEILEVRGLEIAKLLKTSSKGEAVLIELGAGSLEKTSQILLSAAQIAETADNSTTNPITYYALDLEHRELERTLAALQDAIGPRIAGKITTKGMWGTYEDGIRVVERNDLKFPSDVPLHILFLGGTIGNFSKADGDIAFLKSLPLNRKRGDTLLLGVDRAKAVELIERAYGFAAATGWIMNGLKVSGRVLTGDEELFESGNWERYSKYNEELGRYEAGYKSRKDQTIKVAKDVDIVFSKDEVILVTYSNKYTDAEIKTVFDGAGLEIVESWMDKKAQYCLFLLKAVS